MDGYHVSSGLRSMQYFGATICAKEETLEVHCSDVCSIVCSIVCNSSANVVLVTCLHE